FFPGNLLGDAPTVQHDAVLLRLRREPLRRRAGNRFRALELALVRAQIRNVLRQSHQLGAHGRGPVDEGLRLAQVLFFVVAAVHLHRRDPYDVCRCHEPAPCLCRLISERRGGPHEAPPLPLLPLPYSPFGRRNSSLVRNWMTASAVRRKISSPFSAVAKVASPSTPVSVR